jgi:hypothetical protein
VTKKRFASVWDAIEDTSEKAENMKLRSSLMICVEGALGRHWSQSGADRQALRRKPTACLGSYAREDRRVWFGCACEHGGGGRFTREIKFAKSGLIL